MSKYKVVCTKNRSFRGGSNIYLNLITRENNIVIPSILQRLIFHWHHKYILHIGMDRAEEMIFQYLYCSVTINAVWEEVTNCNTFQPTKRSKKQYGTLPAKEVEEIPCKKSIVNLIGAYVIRRKRQKVKLNINAITMIDPVTWWFKITQYDEKRAILIMNLVEFT